MLLYPGCYRAIRIILDCNINREAMPMAAINLVFGARPRSWYYPFASFRCDRLLRY
jgi:hypothetical protein